MRDILPLAVLHVTSVTIRHHPGQADQAELMIRTTHGELVVHLIAEPEHSIRLIDLRARTKKRANILRAAAAWPTDRKR